MRRRPSRAQGGRFNFGFGGNGVVHDIPFWRVHAANAKSGGKKNLTTDKHSVAEPQPKIAENRRGRRGRRGNRMNADLIVDEEKVLVRFNESYFGLIFHRSR